MIEFAHIPLKDFIKKYNPQEPKEETIENFEKEINSLLENASKRNYEESQKSKINEFLKNTYGYECDIYGNVDSAIYVDGKACVLIEVKALNNRNEFPKDRENPLSKAFCQMVFYFLEEIESNNSLKHAIICNAHEFFLFDCKDLLNLFQNDKKITKLHKNCASKEGTDPSTKRFYSDLEEYLKKDFEGKLRYTHFNLNSDDPKELPLIYQVLSHEVLLKQRKTLDANTLNKDFYEELLYILGLEEQNEKGKILIKLSRTQNSLSDALKKQYNNLDDEEVMALLIAWNNRILFLRLLESLLISFNHFEKPFLTIENFKDFNALNTLFFEVLAKKNNEREIKEDKILGKIPYLNSSLFDKTPLESNGHEIRLLKNKPLEIYSKSILKKDKDYQEKKDFSLLEYLFTFLHAYDFTTTPKDIKDNKNTSESRLINPSVLGLVFEKLNGYKEGSFYTPSFITSYMCSESITTIVLDKFNQKYNIECEKLEELKNYLKNNYNYKEDKRKEYLQVLLALRICDPAVGSGHFLVSALNEMVRIAYELGLITSLYRHSLRLENDEIIIHTPTGEIFNYTKPHSENDPHHQIQKELFELKKSIIENCLFGVDINPNSCEITKLRLWIELLKYSYYIFEEGKNTNALETLPNIDINIKCGNSLISRFSLHDDLKKIPNIKKKIQEYKDLVAQYKDPNPLFPLNKTDLTNKIQDLKTTFSLELKDSKTKEELEKAIEKHIKKYNFFALDDKSLLDGLNYFIPSLFGALKLSPKEEEEAFASYGRIRALRKKLDDALSGREYQNAFEWRFEFPEVLDDEGDFLGFDCIIGNPPYIDYRKIDEKTKIFLSKFSSVYKKSKEGSIFVYFIERASQLIIKHGEISFINPIAYLCKPTDHGIRDYIDKNLKITMLIDLSNIKIFESASTYTCINIFKRENKKNEILFQRSDDLTELSSNKDDFLKIPSVNIEHISIFLDPISRHIAERCKTQLGNFCKIFCGLSKTGFRSDVINTNNKKVFIFWNRQIFIDIM